MTTLDPHTEQVSLAIERLMQIAKACEALRTPNAEIANFDHSGFLKIVNSAIELRTAHPNSIISDAFRILEVLHLPKIDVENDAREALELTVHTAKLKEALESLVAAARQSRYHDPNSLYAKRVKVH